ncbi:MAG: hypothetical protein AB4290_14265 [Spirulina sp.]
MKKNTTPQKPQTLKKPKESELSQLSLSELSKVAGGPTHYGMN